VTPVTVRHPRSCCDAAVSATPSAAPPTAALVRVTLDADVLRRLERLASRAGCSSVALIADAVADYVDRRDRADVPAWVGAAGRGDS
jgi:predicted transcriptional regulator